MHDLTSKLLCSKYINETKEKLTKFTSNKSLTHIFEIENKNEDTYCSWIPTNYGHLSFSYMANELYSNNKNTAIRKIPSENSIHYIDIKPEISDTMTLFLSDLYRVLPNQLKPVITIKMQYNEATMTYKGTVFINMLTEYVYDLISKDIIKLNNVDFSSNIDLSKNAFQDIFNHIQCQNDISHYLLMPIQLSSKFILCTNGYVHLNNINVNILTLSENHNEEEFLSCLTGLAVIDKKDTQNFIKNNYDFAPKSLYTALKRMVHYDNHHHIKIDTIIPLMKSSFDPTKILHSLGERLKEIEIKIRHTKTIEPECMYSSYATGIMAYIQSFHDTFFDSSQLVNDEKCNYNLVKEPMYPRYLKNGISFHQNILNSITATSSRVKKNCTSCLDKFKSSLIVSVAWVISSLILLNGIFTFFKDSSNELMRKYTLSYVNNPFIFYMIDIMIFLTIIILPITKKCFYNPFITYLGIDRKNILLGSRYLQITYFGLSLIVVGLLFYLSFKLDRIIMYLANITSLNFDLFSLFEKFLSLISS